MVRGCLLVAGLGPAKKTLDNIRGGGYIGSVEVIICCLLV